MIGLEIMLSFALVVFVLWMYSLFNQGKRVTRKDIIARLQRDNRVLTKKLNRVTGVILILCLFLGPALYSPQNLYLSSDTPAIGNESQVIDDFALSTDGDISTDSIGEAHSNKLRETIADDILYYPDTFTELVTTTEGASEDESGTSIANIASKDGSWWISQDAAVGNPAETWLTLNWSLLTNAESIDFYIYSAITDGSATDYNVSIWDWNADTWDIVQTITPSTGQWDNFTELEVDTDYFSNEKLMVKLQHNDAAGTLVRIWVDYFYVQVNYMTLADSTTTIELADTVELTTGTLLAGNLASVQAVDGTNYQVEEVTGTPGFDFAFNFTSLGTTVSELNLFGYYDGNPAHDVYGQLYDWVAETWDNIDDYPDAGADAWYNVSVDSSDYANGALVLFRIYHTSSGSAGHDFYLDYVEVVTVFSDHYAESFADVSDWSTHTGDGISSDGDIGTIEIPADSGYDLVCDNSPSDSWEGRYVTVWHKVNDTAGVTLLVVLKSGDDYTGDTVQALSMTESTSWKCEQFRITSSAVVGSITIIARDTSGGGVKIQFDVLRGSPSDEMGWQHDGSTTSGLSDDAQASVTYTYSTDGDKLTINGTRDSAVADYMDVWFNYDTTTTVADIERDYYPFLAFSISSFSTVGCSITWGFIGDGYLISGLSLSTGINRASILAASTSNSEKRILWFAVSGVDQGDTFEIELDFVKASSIANWTVTESGTTTDDYLYVDAGVLYSNVDSGTIEANHDSAISFISATYSVYNLTTSGTAPEFSQYVSSWSTYSDDTRGATSTGTVTDIKLRFDSTEILSAIEFIEDNTAPIISNFWTVPYTPTEEDSITLAIFETDIGAGAYEVTFNAVDYPTGFNDVDLEATQSTNQTGLWSYTIDSDDVLAGYYAVLVTVSDGAQSATSLEIFRVTTIYLQITDIVLITATDTLAQISGHSNKDCSYQVYENDTLEGSGSVSEGWFSISWTKDITAGAYIELGIKFYVSTYTEWTNGSYSVASADSLNIDIEDWGPLSTTIQLIGTTNSAFNYYVYRGGVYNSETGSVSLDTSFSFTIARNTGVGSNTYQVYFNSSSISGSRWFNFSETISTSNEWAYVSPHISTGEGIELNKFILYVNGTRVSNRDWRFYNNTAYSYEICIKDFYGNELYNTTHTWARDIDILLQFYTLKVYSTLIDKPVHFQLSYGGTTIGEYFGPNEVLYYYLAARVYTYTFTKDTVSFVDTLDLSNADYYFTVEELDLWDIWYKPTGGGGGDDDAVELLTLNTIQLGLLGIFGFMFVLQIDPIQERIPFKKRKSTPYRAPRPYPFTPEWDGERTRDRTRGSGLE